MGLGMGNIEHLGLPQRLMNKLVRPYWEQRVRIGSLPALPGDHKRSGCFSLSIIYTLYSEHSAFKKSKNRPSFPSLSLALSAFAETPSA